MTPVALKASCQYIRRQQKCG